MPREGEDARWRERAGSRAEEDPHRDVTGALHDVSNALTVLLGWVAEARATGASPADISRALAIVEDRARSARDLARRAIGAHAAIDPREQSADALVGEIVLALSVEAQRAKVTLSVRGARSIARLPLADDASQVLTNVVMNAIAWTPPAGSVTIEMEDDATGVHILVGDEGPGVEPGEVELIFVGSSSRKGGAGVGLKHARAVARAAGGNLELLHTADAAGDVRSDGPRHGRGATFRIRWPRVEPALASAPVSAVRSAVLAGTRVLVVEDDDGVAMLLESALTARGATVAIARTAAELAHSASFPHDAALVDLSPIANDVRGAVDLLRRGSPDVAIVLISGRPATMPDGLDSGRIRWVKKPFEVLEIIEALADSGVD